MSTKSMKRLSKILDSDVLFGYIRPFISEQICIFEENLTL